MKREEIDALHPELLRTLSGHEGIGFVVDSEADGPIVLGGSGSRRLRDDEVTGEDLFSTSGRTPWTTC